MFGQQLKIALISLKSNKTRTALTVLGIVIGIAAVIMVMSAGQSLKAIVLEQVETFGTDFIQVEVKVPNTAHVSVENAASQAMGVAITTLKLSDVEAIKKLPNIKNNYAGVMGQQIVSYLNQQKQIILFGVSPTFAEIDKTKVAAGRFFIKEEDRQLENVAVLGPVVKDKLFGESDAKGELIRIGNQKFRVIGIMEKRGATFGFDMDEMIFLPIQTLQKKVMGIEHVSFIFNQVADNSLADLTAEEIKGLLRERHHITDPTKDDFSVTTMAEAMAILDTITWAITLLLVGIAGISLLVGGVGISNIMYVSVIERTYEIGLRKAVGAKSSNILLQFLYEAIVMTILGAILGIVFGIGLAYLVSLVASNQGFSWPFVISVKSLFLAASMAAVVGLVFGVWPARQAAKLDPVEALRYNR